MFLEGLQFLSWAQRLNAFSSAKFSVAVRRTYSFLSNLRISSGHDAFLIPQSICVPCGKFL